MDLTEETHLSSMKLIEKGQGKSTISTSINIEADQDKDAHRVQTVQPPIPKNNTGIVQL